MSGCSIILLTSLKYHVNIIAKSKYITIKIIEIDVGIVLDVVKDTVVVRYFDLAQ